MDYGILSGDHLKSASDLGIPLVAVGLLYKNGYFSQKINGYGQKATEYHNIDLFDMPINPVKDDKGEDLTIYVKFPKRRLYLKVWQINVGRVKLYLLDSDIEKNNEEDRDVTLRLYGKQGDKLGYIADAKTIAKDADGTDVYPWPANQGANTALNSYKLDARWNGIPMWSDATLDVALIYAWQNLSKAQKQLPIHSNNGFLGMI